MFLSSLTRLLSRFILTDSLRNAAAMSSVLGAMPVTGVPLNPPLTLRGVSMTSRGVPAASLAPLHGAIQRVGDIITAGAEVTEVSRQRTAEKTSSEPAVSMTCNT